MAEKSAPTTQTIPTTTGDRLATAAVSTALWGGIGAIASLAVNAIQKYVMKKPVAMFGKMDAYITGGVALASGVWAFFTADKSKEVALENALDAVNDPNNKTPDADKQKQREKIISDAMDGKEPPAPQVQPPQPQPEPSTKHRDAVVAQRDVAATQQAAI